MEMQGFLLLISILLTSAAQAAKICVGDSVPLTCPGITDYHGTIVRFNKKVVREKHGKYEMLENGSMVLKNITLDDEGNYSYDCHYNVRSAQCKWKKERCIVKVRINCEDLIFNVGSTIMMTCKAFANKEHITAIEWKQKVSGKGIVTIAKNNITTDYSKTVFTGRLQSVGKTLKITHARKTDEGSYVCIAEGTTGKRKGYWYNIHVVNRKTTTQRPASQTTCTTQRAHHSGTGVRSTTHLIITPITTQPTPVDEKTTRKVPAIKDKTPLIETSSKHTENKRFKGTTPLATTLTPIDEKTTRNVPVMNDNLPLNETTRIHTAENKTFDGRPKVAYKNCAGSYSGADCKLYVCIITLTIMARLMTGLIIGL